MAIALAQSALSAAGSTSMTTLSITLGSPTVAGNCVIVCYACGSSGTTPVISGITLGGAAGNFASSTANTNDSAFGYVAVWADPNCVGGATAITVSTTGGSGSVGNGAIVFEFSGLVTSSVFDKGSSLANTSTATSWTSGTSATTAQASEVWVGVTGQVVSASQPAITGPVSPWTNSSVNGGAYTGFDPTVMAGYNIVSATGGAVYAGTVSPASFSGALVATYKGAAPAIIAGSKIRISQQAVKRASLW